MQIRVLGCSGSIASGSRTTAFLIDDDVLIDAGTGVGDLSLDELARIEHIFVTHSHLDHVVSIGLLADSVTRRRMARQLPPITVHALPQTITALQTHVFNGVIWPDFTRLPTPEHPVLQFAALAVGQVVALGTRQVEVLPASHTVPAVGYAVSPTTTPATELQAAQRPPHAPPSPAWVFTGDTGPNPALWQRLAQMPVAALVVETAFRDDEAQLADVSKHLCPARLKVELAQLRQPTDVYITHIKPGEVDAVMTEIAAQHNPHRIHALVTGQLMVVGA